MTMSHTITLTGNYGYSSYQAPSGLDAGTTIDATNASWIVANQGSQTNLYPFQVSGAGANLLIKGGTINGEVSQTADWKVTYVNSAAVRINSANSFIIDDWTITRPWDGIRPGGTGTFVIDNTYIANARDDAVENDDAMSGTIRDSLFDGVFSGISLGDGDVNGSNNTVTMDSMLLRMKSYPYKGEVTHGSPFKLDKGTGNMEVSPHLKITNSVIAIEKVGHESYERLQHAWDRTVESSNNVFLNLSDTPLPDNYPKPPAGWTTFQGQAARDYWDKAKADWLAGHADGATDPNPQPTPEPSTPSITTVSDDVSPVTGPVANGGSTNDTTPALTITAEVGSTVRVYDGTSLLGTAAETATAGTFTFTAASLAEGSHSFTATATNAAGNTSVASGTYAITISPSDATPPSAPTPTFSGANFTGTSKDETIVGNAQVNRIEAKDGADKVWGGPDNDTFVFTRGGDMDNSAKAVDLYMDFTPGADKFDFRAIDANEKASGNQDFSFIGEAAFGTATAGQVRSFYDASKNVTRIELNTDADNGAEYFFHVDGKHTFTAADFIL
jgi:hypothetical protein